MTTRRPTRRMICRAAILGATLALAVTAPLSASADSADPIAVFTCSEVNDEDLPRVEADECEWTSPIIIPDPFVIQPEYASWHYRCEYGHAAGTAVAGDGCERRYHSDDAE
jgi:hypothetical protein